MFRKDWQIVNLDRVEAKYAAGEVVDGPSLVAKGLIKKAEGLVKILGDGNVTKALVFQVDKVSAQAKAKIEKAGGKVETPADGKTTAGA